ncbi:MAG: polyphosphate glucokinase [Polyangiaceae bacterium]|jgi:polyphosphate glucokinase|nr:polyphosphate glucokinase [Polyangiaceae bacterium]
MPIPYKHRERRKTRISTSTALLRADGPSASRTLCIDIGGTGVKMIVLDPSGEPINARARELTPKPATWSAVLDLIRSMLRQQPSFDRISVGYPGVVQHGVTLTAVNLDPSWIGKNLQTELEVIAGVPTRVINDADLQGYGVIEGVGVEMVLTLGTGVGSALFLDGHLVPNLELGHHPFQKDKTYEERLSDAQLKEHGKQKWSKRVGDMIDTLSAIFNYDRLHIGGGNAEHIRIDLPDNVSLFDNVDGMTGGIALWEDES